uniref:Uncharacterized protein n=1 Tax=Chromera velia CCMP2878 TaxID=1169474 RepID=A0A0G4GT13_9ALVE|eukprot:Cvel_5147.t1-p1 / transcript=Cvel_5147.t1 / gene=Cvel_5147 / organism=Chromera_velia_CCMP2878 / gene_product=Carbonyl reductase family member 4, putative / transcript_product=Carbonyl reductase family member 4, putative / location=Cvel_scaffold235:98003-100452(+) / protein_length=271 / sequence_SO=supercontig / SO=protein_coding / is_pseudo=false
MSSPRVIIVGGSSGMGRGCARAVVRAGGRAVICSRSQEKLDKAARNMAEAAANPKAGLEQVETRVLDFTEETAVESFFSGLEEKSVDALVVTALGPAAHGPFLSQPTEDFRRMMENKFFGPLFCAKHGARVLKDGGGIVFVSGILSQRPGKNCSALSGANGAIEGLTRALALELGPRLRVNCLSPGFVDTERFDRMDPQRKDVMLQSVAASVPLKSVGDPDQIGDALLFLATHSYTTGVVLNCDGGHHVRQYAVPNAVFSQCKDQGIVLDL